MNILFSTTRQWNPGDEFILLGCINLLKSCGLDFNPIIYNRNPQIRRKGKAKKLKFLDQCLFNGNIAPFLDNSIKDDYQSEHIDLVVFAGSPEWRGKRLAPLYKKIVENNIPVIILGIGSNREFLYDKNHFSQNEMDVLSKALLITCRDDLTYEGLKEINAHKASCPALFSADQYKEITSVKKIGLIYGSHKAVTHNNVSESTFNYLKSLYEHLQNTFENVEFEFVAHYIDELETFSTDFPGGTIRYSYDSKDYIDIYSKYDFVIGHRVHGVGISASQGIPGICISHDLRGVTAEGFNASVIQKGTDLEQVTEMIQKEIANIESKVNALRVHKNTVLKQYQSLLVPVLKKCGEK